MVYTSIEQSRKLLELGIEANTADMWWTALNWQETEYYVEVKQDGINQPKKVIPAWSLSALESLMPYHIIENNNRYAFYQVKGFNRQGHTYKFKYMANSNLCLYETSYYNNAIDAAFEMVCWLKENNKI